MMLRSLLSFALAAVSTFAYAQNVVPYSGTDTSTACTGTLYDHGGSTGSYSNGANGSFYITPPGGGNLSMTFTQFQLEGCCDYVRIYDGIGFSGTILFSGNGTALPNGGSAIIAPSGVATVRFTSDGSVTRAGFTMNWSAAGGSATPSASFSLSTNNLPLNFPVTFNNTSSTGDYSWDFGDGSTSTDENPSHSYATSGSYTIRLIVSACGGANDTATQNIVVQGAPVFTVLPDTLRASVSCGAYAQDTISISNDSTGTLGYTIEGVQVPAVDPYIVNESFETGLQQFRKITTSTAFSVTTPYGSAPGGAKYLSLAGWSSTYDGLVNIFGNSTPTEISYYLNIDNSYRYQGRVIVGQDTSNPTGPQLFQSYTRYGYLYVYTLAGTYSFPLNTSAWNQIALKNIDYSTSTYDLEINGVVVLSGMSFTSTGVTSVSTIYLSNTSSSSVSYFDLIQIKNDDIPDPLTFSQNNGNLLGGNSVDILAGLSTAGIPSGTYRYDVKVRTNGTGTDSLHIIPFIVDISGDAEIDLDKNCISFNSVFTALTVEDSVRIINSGCDELTISNISSTSADLVPNITSATIPAFDTAYVRVTFNPSTVGSYSDTLNFTTSIGDTAICLTGIGVASAILNTDSSAYTVNSVGCNDSAYFNVDIFNTGQTNLTWVATGRKSTSDDFNASTNPSSLWEDFGSNIIGNFCYNRSGNSVATYGTNRIMRTVPFNTSGNDSVSFWLMPGNTTASPCEDPNSSAHLYVEYTPNGGTSWYQIGYISSYSYGPNFYKFRIPYSGTVQVRLSQPIYYTADINNYLIDDFNITGGIRNIDFNPSSGTTVVNDTTTLQGSIYTGDLTTGVYDFVMTVTSNDPANGSLEIPVTLNIQGEPIVNLSSSSCMDFGTVVNGNILTDSVLVWNSGCDSLVFSNITSTNSEFSGAVSHSVLQAGDSTYLSITYNSGTVGTFNDTLTINNNDTAVQFCVTAVGIGAPNFDVTPDTLYFSTTSCDDSLYADLTVSNLGGLSTLTFNMDSLRGGSSSRINITMLKTGADVSSEYPNTLAAITAYLPNANVSESMASNSAALTSDLANAHVLVIPEQEYMSSSVAYQLSSAVQSFMNNGGSVIVCGNTTSIIGQLGVFSYSGSATSSSMTFGILDPNHEVFAGVNTTGFYAYSQTTFLAITNPGAELLAYYNGYPNYASVASMDYGSGKLGFFGFDFYNYDANTQIAFTNLIKYVSPNAGIVDWGYLTNNSDSVAIDDSSSTGVHIITRGLENGRYIGNIPVITNDPSNATISIPVVLDVNGQAAMRVTANCLDFDSLIVGLQKVDTTTIYNDGCDTLWISSSTSSTGDYSVGGTLPIGIPPYDSMAVDIVFSPSAMGTRNDTLWVQASSDTLPICVNGIGLGAPVVDPESDSLIVVLNKCDNFSLETFDISNSGQGQLDYTVTFGEYYEDTTSQVYTTSGATTNHIFNNTPTTADSIVITVITEGDFDSYNEYYTLQIEGSNVLNTYGTTNPYGVADTFQHVLPSGNFALSTWLADGTLDIDLLNTYYVAAYTTMPNRMSVKVQIYSSAMPAWLTFPSTATGSLAVGATDTKTLLFTATNVPAGVYNVDMNILSNDPVNPSKVVPIVFDVREEANIALSDTCVYFPTTQLGDTSTAQIWIVNDGCLPLNVTNIVAASNVFKISPTNLTVPGKDSVQVTVSFIPTAVTNYSSIVTVTSNAGTETFCVNGSANAKPIADFQFGIINDCDGQVYFSDHSTMNPTSYTWEFGDGNISTTQNPVYSYEKPGTYRVRLTASNSYGWDTISQYVTVNPLYVDFSVSMNGSVVTNDTLHMNVPVQFNDSSLTPNTWKWFLGDGSTDTVQNPNHTYINKGTFQISLEAQDTAGCKTTRSKTYWVVDASSVEEWANSRISVYPNPSFGIFHVDINTAELKDVELEILDTRGALLQRISVENGMNADIDLTEYPKAMYMLRIVSEGKTIGHRRLVVK